ncbi:UEV domain-containing protein [Phycomyces nitens]|nr:UEV domain-containing protein [Phycomyces nitens]
MSSLSGDIKSWLRIALKNYQDAERTVRDVDAVLQMYISLTPKMDPYTYNDGHTQLLLCLHGTIPITYRSIPYNIPVAFWIPSEYPLFPPIPYVKPTANMLVREGKHVDKSGLCYHSYRSLWKTDVNNHTLLELIAILQGVFGQEPPVFTKPPSNPLLSTPPQVGSPQKQETPDRAMFIRPSPSPSTPTNMTPPHIPPSTNTSLSRWTGDGTAYYNIQKGLASMSLSPSDYTAHTTLPVPTPTPTPLSSTSTPIAPTSSPAPVSAAPTVSPAARPAAVPPTDMGDLQDRLCRKVAERMEQFNQVISRDIDSLLMTNRQLNDGDIQIEHEQRMLIDIRERLKNNIQVISKKTIELDEAITTANAIPDVSMDEAIYGTTVVYNQMFDLVADDNAIVDTIYYLSKALNTECIDLGTFMKCTRSLAREQFMKRALLKKISEA